MREAGLAEATAEDRGGLDRRTAKTELTLLDLWVEQGGRPQRTALVPVELAAVTLVRGGEIEAGKDLAASASTVPPGGGDYVDENGNANGTGRGDPRQRHPPSTVDDDSDWVTYWSGGGDGDDGGAAGGGDLGEPQDAPDCRDRVAVEAKAEIEARDDVNRDESGILLYRNSEGQVVKSSVIAGDGGEIELSSILEVMQREGISFSQVIGFVHNHDSRHYATGATPAEAAANERLTDTHRGPIGLLQT